MSDSELIQGTDEWKLARCGSLGASRIADAVAKTKTGWGASRANLQSELVVERLTGKPIEGYTSQAMINGTAREPDARAAYEFLFNCNVQQVGLIRHPKIKGSHASPDGLVDDDGLIEIKCPEPKAHIEVLLEGKIPQRYLLQMQWQMACTGRQQCDFVSWHPDFPESMRLFVQTVKRDDALIAQLEKDIVQFLSEVEARVSELHGRYEGTKAA